MLLAITVAFGMEWLDVRDEPLSVANIDKLFVVVSTAKTYFKSAEKQAKKEIENELDIKSVMREIDSISFDFFDSAESECAVAAEAM